MLSGFYTAGAAAEVFDECNEVRLPPAQVMRDFRAVDFKSGFHTKPSAFWRDFAGDFRTTSRASYLASALQDHQAGWLSDEDPGLRAWRRENRPLLPASLKALRASAPAGQTVSVWTFDIIGYEASDILRIVVTNG